ncbi:MAG: VWA domain-containing protein, partial [Pirellulaceae bacterium]|nr:VWA domain-containing protein [Pirellulaceae bacterium]
MRSLTNSHAASTGLILATFFFAFLFAPSVSQGQGFLLQEDESVGGRLPRYGIRPPREVPTHSYKIKELGISAKLNDSLAEVQVSQTFTNTGRRQIEASLVLPLPYDGAIKEMTYLVDGKEYPAQLVEAKKARSIYENYVRKNQDPALLEWVGTGMFKTSVFPIPAGASRTVTIKYNQVCRKQGGLTELSFPLSTVQYTSKPVENVKINLHIQSKADIKNIYSPTHPLNIKRPNNRSAILSYHGVNEIPTGDFRLFFDNGDQAIGANIISYRPNKNEPGFFMMLVSPEIKAANDDRQLKNILFVLDRSGSMSGTKLTQTKNALKFVLNNLREGDTFNIVNYDSAVESFRPELQRFNEQTRKEALSYTEAIYSGGSTNINEALRVALGQIQDTTRPNYLLFLTDGLPTAGETNEAKIAANVTEYNKLKEGGNKARLFSFGVGFDLNSRLLDKLSAKNSGQTSFVRPNEDIEEAVSRLYRQIASPVLT